jgi:glycosyltransferase involved in cell wall biosynthesis
MAHEYYPENVNEKLLRYLKQELPRTARLATLIIADSQNTKMDILKFLNVPENKVKVIYIGIEKAFRPIDNPTILEATRKKYQLPEKFILYVGAIQPRKNIAGLITAYHLLCQDPNFKYHLVVAGGVGWKKENINHLVRELGLKDRIRFPGYISPSDLPILYSLAEVFVFPSFYEGFGLPVLEAMACGTPVVTSNLSSLPEVGSDAVIY